MFYLWLRFITFGCRSAHLAYHGHKSGHKTLIITKTTKLHLKIEQYQIVAMYCCMRMNNRIMDGHLLSEYFKFLTVHNWMRCVISAVNHLIAQFLCLDGYLPQTDDTSNIWAQLLPQSSYYLKWHINYNTLPKQIYPSTCKTQQ